MPKKQPGIHRWVPKKLAMFGAWRAALPSLIKQTGGVQLGRCLIKVSRSPPSPPVHMLRHCRNTDMFVVCWNVQCRHSPADLFWSCSTFLLMEMFWDVEAFALSATVAENNKSIFLSLRSELLNDRSTFTFHSSLITWLQMEAWILCLVPHWHAQHYKEQHNTTSLKLGPALKHSSRYYKVQSRQKIQF